MNIEINMLHTEKILSDLSGEAIEAALKQAVIARADTVAAECLVEFIDSERGRRQVGTPDRTRLTLPEGRDDLIDVRSRVRSHRVGMEHAGLKFPDKLRLCAEVCFLWDSITKRIDATLDLHEELAESPN